MAISFQTVLLKCAEMTQAFTYGVCTQFWSHISTVKVLFIVAYVSVWLQTSDSMTRVHVCHVCVLLCKCTSSKSILQVSQLVFLPAEWWQCRVCCSNTELTPRASQAYFQLHIFQQPPAWVIWVVMTWQSNWFAPITPRIWQPAPFTVWALRSSCL